MEKELLTKHLLETVYLTLKQYDYSSVSLKSVDLLKYVPKIEEILKEKDLLDSDLFIKTPVEETYDQFKNFLISRLLRPRVGYFNENYDAIILNCTDYYIKRCQDSLENYEETIFKCCYAITNDIQFIEQMEKVKQKVIK